MGNGRCGMCGQIGDPIRWHLKLCNPRGSSCTACILRTQRLGYSPKNTYHLSSSTAKQQRPHENSETAFNLPTLNMSFFHKVQLGSMLLDPASMLCSVARESPHAHCEHALLPQSPTCTNPGSMILDPTSMLCSAAGHKRLLVCVCVCVRVPASRQYKGNAVHVVRTQCEVLDVGKYSNPSFGPFSQVFGSATGFFF